MEEGEYIMKQLTSSEVKLVDYMGSDLTVVNAARVSFNKHVEQFSMGDERLIKFLAEHNHWTPFGHCSITIREKVPIFVARQRFKHTVGFCYNEVSRRYVSHDPEFFMPDEWRANPENKKQGSSKTEIVEWLLINERTPSLAVEQHYNKSAKLYNELLDAGVCAEQARMVLPQGMMTEYYVTGSLAAWARAYKLRVEETAQEEIRSLAEEWDKIIRPIFPVSWKYLIG